MKNTTPLTSFPDFLPPEQALCFTITVSSNNMLLLLLLEWALIPSVKLVPLLSTHWMLPSCSLLPPAELCCNSGLSLLTDAEDYGTLCTAGWCDVTSPRMVFLVPWVHSWLCTVFYVLTTNATPDSARCMHIFPRCSDVSALSVSSIFSKKRFGGNVFCPAWRWSLLWLLELSSWNRFSLSVGVACLSPLSDSLVSRFLCLLS